MGLHDAPPSVKCVVSLGCGWTKASRPSFALRILNTASNFSEYYLANTEAKHRDFERLVNRMVDRADHTNLKYVRLNCPTGNVRFDMADYKKMGELEVMTREYLRTGDAQRKVFECAELLASQY